MASTTFRFWKFWTARQFFFQILCSKKNFENFFWSDQKTGLTARRVHYGPFRSPRSISGPYQKMTIPLLNSPKPHPLLTIPGIIDLFSYKVYGGPRKCWYGIINRNPRCPKRDTLYVTDGSLWFYVDIFVSSDPNNR